MLAVATAVFVLRKRPEHPVRELVPTRVTRNSSEAPIQTLALSPDGKYLAYSDKNGVHVRSMQTADTRVLSDSKGMFVMYWAADATQFFTGKFASGQFILYSVSLPGGVPHSLGDTVPSPGGLYSVAFSNQHGEIRRVTDGKVYSLDRKDAPRGSIAWSPRDKRLAIVFHPPGLSVPDRIEVLDAESGRWTTVASVLGISGVAWLSDNELVCVQDEHAPRRDSNLWLWTSIPRPVFLLARHTVSRSGPIIQPNS